MNPNETGTPLSPETVFLCPITQQPILTAAYQVYQAGRASRLSMPPAGNLACLPACLTTGGAGG